MEFLDFFIDLLQASIKKNGNQPLTVAHLKNLLSMAKREYKRIEAEWEENMTAIENYDPDIGDH